MATCTHRTVVDIPRSALLIGAGLGQLRLADACGLEVASASTATGPGALPGRHIISGTGANLSLTMDTPTGRNFALAASFRCCGEALGGAIYAEDSENVSFKDCTFARNYAIAPTTNALSLSRVNLENETGSEATHMEQAVHLWARRITTYPPRHTLVSIQCLRDGCDQLSVPRCTWWEQRSFTPSTRISRTLISLSLATRL